uniref:Caspase recruitment domain-containing protein 19 n=1 Tax=Hucho hucho TaxID=62062 RepID=A0A4W5R7Z6_9TELE
MGDSFQDQLLEDSRFLRADRRLDTELVDKLILQLNRIYPQILTDKEATKFRDLDVPTCVRLAELLAHLQGKGEEACREFYRALHLHVEEVYFSLPTRLRLRDSIDPFTTAASPTQQRYVLNDRGNIYTQEVHTLSLTNTCTVNTHTLYDTYLSFSHTVFCSLFSLQVICSS